MKIEYYFHLCNFLFCFTHKHNCYFPAAFQVNTFGTECTCDKRYLAHEKPFNGPVIFMFQIMSTKIIQ